MADPTPPEGPPSVLPPEYYTAIGRVAAVWAQLELEMNLAIWELANVRQSLGACITAQMIGPGPRLKALVSLIHQRGGTDAMIGEMHSLGGKIQGAADNRNRILHDPHFKRQDDGSLHRLEISTKRQLTFDFVPPSAESVAAVSAEINKRKDEFRDLISRILRELPTFSRREFRRSGGVRSYDLDPDSDG